MILSPEIRELLRCPADLGKLEFRDGSCRCQSCGADYPLAPGGAPILFVEGAVEKRKELEQGALRKKSGLRAALEKILKPPADLGHNPLFHKFRKLFLEESRNNGGWLLNVAAGGTDFGERSINLDISLTETLHAVADAHRLPIPDGSMSGVICEVSIFLFEDFDQAVREMIRVLKPGGLVFVTCTFMYPHSMRVGGKTFYLPSDKARYTRSGLEWKFSAFEPVSLEASRGPHAAISTMLIENGVLWGTLLFRSAFVEKVLRVAFGWLFAPLALLDLLFYRHPGVDRTAKTFYIYGRLKDKA